MNFHKLHKLQKKNISANRAPVILAGQQYKSSGTLGHPLSPSIRDKQLVSSENRPSVLKTPTVSCCVEN